MVLEEKKYVAKTIDDCSRSGGCHQHGVDRMRTHNSKSDSYSYRYPGFRANTDSGSNTAASSGVRYHCGGDMAGTAQFPRLRKLSGHPRGDDGNLSAALCDSQGFWITGQSCFGGRRSAYIG